MDAPKDLIDKWKKLDLTKFESWITGVEYVGEAILQAVKGGIGYIERYSKYINPKLVARMQGFLFHIIFIVFTCFNFSYSSIMKSCCR